PVRYHGIFCLRPDDVHVAIGRAGKCSFRRGMCFAHGRRGKRAQRQCGKLAAADVHSSNLPYSCRTISFSDAASTVVAARIAAITKMPVTNPPVASLRTPIK